MLVRLFVVLSDPEERHRIGGLLAQPHVHVIVADDATEGWARLASESYDLGIVDRPPQGDELEDLLTRLGRLPDRPGLLLLDPAEEPEVRAGWLTAGILAVLDPRLADDVLAATLDSFVQRRRQERLERLSAARRTRTAQPPFISVSPTTQAVLETARRVALADSPVLILGETGVGKERLALLLHTSGRRSPGPFVPVNCAAIPSELFESELFGHHRGAFTGAVRTRRGKFELAHQGTIFLDEVGEVPLHLQAKLLRVLQEGRITPVGSDSPVEIDARVIAATNRDLRAEMEAGRFRRDLYYRLGVVELTIPPLRERREDIPVLAQSYLTELRSQLGREVRGFQPEALSALERYGWPGNVRELVNVLERAVLLCQSEEIGLDDLPESIAECVDLPVLDGGAPMEIPAEPRPGGFTLPEAWAQHPWRAVREALVEQGERAYLSALLRQTGGRIGLTARRAGLSTRSLFEKMRRLGLRKEDFRAPE